MIRLSSFASVPLAVFGLGASGLATVRALVAGGAHVVAWDDSEAARSAAAEAGARLVDFATLEWGRMAALVLAPGVPLTHPAPHWAVAGARAAGVEVIGDIELFCRERARTAPGSPFIAITGTNGKSTTTALTAHLLRALGRDVAMGGNIGEPILALAPPAPDRIHVIEISSFQIDLTPSLAPTVGVLINLSADHLDRHGPADDPALAMRNYAAIKERLVAAAGVALIGVDDAHSEAICERLARARGADRVRPVSVLRTLDRGLMLDGTRLAARAHAGALLDVVADVAGIGSLRGRHNAQNALFAIGAVLASGIDAGETARLSDALRRFPGLPHRMEEVGRLGRILFINDSKATNADSTEKALLAFAGGIHWIVGGKAKEGGINSLAPLFPRVARAYLVGASSDEFAAALEGRVAFERCGTIDVALERATAAAAAAGDEGPDPVVLLSPACASYDQFRSFVHRGDTFREHVRAVIAGRSGGRAP